MQGNVIIPLTSGKVAVIDVEDADRVLRHTWHVDGRYVSASIPGRRGNKVYLHRFLLDVGPGVCVDHRDGNGLTNTRANIRVATVSQNLANSRLPVHNTSGYRGVYWHKQAGKWAAQIQVRKRHLALGAYDTAEAAARAYDACARANFGEFARLNFPDE